LVWAPRGALVLEEFESIKVHVWMVLRPRQARDTRRRPGAGRRTARRASHRPRRSAENGASGSSPTSLAGPPHHEGRSGRPPPPRNPAPAASDRAGRAGVAWTL